MDPPTDQALPLEFADSQSESAFRELVARSADLARDVNEQTFASLPKVPAAWLVACHPLVGGK